MNLKVKQKTVRYLHTYKIHKGSFIDVMANVGDKIIFMYKGEVISGEIVDVGMKYIYIKEYPLIHKKNSYQYSSRKVCVEDIERIAVYPKCYQRISDIWCNSKDKSCY